MTLVNCFGFGHKNVKLRSFYTNFNFSKNKYIIGKGRSASSKRGTGFVGSNFLP